MIFSIFSYQFTLTEILTIISIIVTTFMVIFTYLTLKENQKSRKETNSAEVIAYFKSEGNDLYFIIENNGKTLAKDINITSNPILKNTKNKEFKNLNFISIMPPKFKVKTYFDELPNKIEEYGGFKEYELFIAYTNIYNEKLKINYRINLNYIKDIEWIENRYYSIETSLSGIKTELFKIDQKLASIESIQRKQDNDD